MQFVYGFTEVIERLSQLACFDGRDGPCDRRGIVGLQTFLTV